jgi:hypothetical protein
MACPKKIKECIGLINEKISGMRGFRIFPGITFPTEKEPVAKALLSVVRELEHYFPAFVYFYRKIIGSHVH